MSSVTELHPEANVRQERATRAVLLGNLLSTGLRMPGVETAYRAATFAGATDEIAWEAARRHELTMIGFPDEIHATGGLNYPRGLTDEESSRKRRQALIDTCRALPNPFSGAADPILRGNADLERAA